MNKLHLQLVSPEKNLLNAEYDSLSIDTAEGQITVLPGHIPLVAKLKSGELITKAQGKASTIHIAGGFVQVKENNQVIILADAAEHVEEIDEARAKAAQEKAMQVMSEAKISDEEYALAAASLERSLSRMRIKRKHSSSRNPITGDAVFKE